MEERRWQGKIADFARPLPYFVGLSLAVVAIRVERIDPAPANVSSALASALAQRGLSATPDDVQWLERDPGVGGAFRANGRALVRANAPQEPADIYVVDVRLSPQGALLGTDALRNLTKSSGVDETRPLLRGPIAAFATLAGGIATAVHTLDLSGADAPVEFTRTQRFQLAITNLQQTGQRRGIVRTAFALDPVATAVRLEFRDDELLDVSADGRVLLLDPRGARALEGAAFVRIQPDARARPGQLLPWSAERARELPWLGAERLQWVKAVTFTALDWVVRARAALFATSEKELADELGTPVRSGPPPLTDPEIGFPPPKLAAAIEPKLPGEGEWLALSNDPFITPAPGTPPAFATTFVRPEPKRPFNRIHVTLWDPRQLVLHMEAGTVEPQSATGEAGPGMIPRTPEVLSNVVAGFNGGFQAVHGEYGMQANGIVYLPPKPYAATVFELRDGTTAMGSWPDDERIPEDVVSFRQNLTALVEGGKINPWRRTWWGGTPVGWADNIHTVRSGVCITDERFVGYFWGSDISAETLAKAMLLARCSYGVHLDMNPGLAGFEFYNVQHAHNFTPLGRPLQDDWEFEGVVRQLPEYRFRARRMIRAMKHMNAPQYIHRDARDFFYLTRRPMIPGAALTPLSAFEKREPGEGVWRTKGLPQYGFPHAVATTWLRPFAERPEARATVARIDPQMLATRAHVEGASSTPAVLTFAPGTRPSDGLTVWFSERTFVVAQAPPAVGAVPLLSGRRTTGPEEEVRSAACVQDEDGMLAVVELSAPTPGAGPTLDGLLARLGCSTRLVLASDAAVLLGSSLDLAGNEAPAPPLAVSSLARAEVLAARRYFEGTPVLPPETWQPLHQKRVRYVRKAAPRPSTTGTPPAPAKTASPGPLP